jgi:hypothetical protein
MQQSSPEWCKKCYSVALRWTHQGDVDWAGRLEHHLLQKKACPVWVIVDEMQLVALLSPALCDALCIVL